MFSSPKLLIWGSMGDFAGLVMKPKLLLGYRGQCGLRSVLLPPCHCTGSLAALSSEAAGVFCSGELALSQSLPLPREGMFILFLCSFCTEKRMSSSPGCGLYGLWYPCHSLNLHPQIVLPLPGASFLKERRSKFWKVFAVSLVWLWWQGNSAMIQWVSRLSQENSSLHLGVTQTTMCAPLTEETVDVAWTGKWALGRGQGWWRMETAPSSLVWMDRTQDLMASISRKLSRSCGPERCLKHQPAARSIPETSAATGRMLWLSQWDNLDQSLDKTWAFFSGLQV